MVIKKRFSAFFQTSLDMMLRRCRVDRVVLCGFQTPNCIRASAFDAVSLDYPEVVGAGRQRAWRPACSRSRPLLPTLRPSRLR